VVRATDVALAVQRPRDVSFRTVLFGRIAAIERDDGPIVRVDIRLPGDERIVALVTRKAVDELAIDAGDDVFAMVKATALDERALAR
jgi:molybdate transport system ATP-binding protein